MIHLARNAAAFLLAEVAQLLNNTAEWIEPKGEDPSKNYTQVDT